MYNPVEISRIDRQIEDLQRLKSSYQAMPQPINNIITSPTTSASTPLFEARFTTENPSDIFVQNKTAFIDLKNGKLSIKEPDGELKEYFIVLPKDEKDVKIENLERKLRDMENRLNTTYLQQLPSEMSADTINNTTTNTYTTTTVNAENSTDFSDSNTGNNGGSNKKSGKIKFGK